MRGFFDRLRWSLSNFMVGRYGVDTLSKHICMLALVLWVLSLFAFRYIFMVLYDVCIVWVLYRGLSRNIYKRQRELTLYLSLREKAAKKKNLQKKKWADRKTHRYIRCACGQVLRVPRGKGKIKIRCSACGKEIVKRT